MLKAALLENIKTKPDIFGTRQFIPLTPSVKPLPTNPPIIGNTWYKPGPIDKKYRNPEELDSWYRQRYGVSYKGEAPGSQFYRTKLAVMRSLNTTPVSAISEPNQFNPSRQ